jgi:hypothetical protein
VSRGSRVVVASRTERPHVALWRRLDVAAEPPRGLVPRDARVFLALRPGPRDDAAALYGTLLPRLVGHAWRQGARSVTVAGPAGDGHPHADAFLRASERWPDAERVATLRVAALFGLHDAVLWPLVRSLRERGVARVPAAGQPAWALCVDDAARAAWEAPAGVHALRGPELVRLEDAVDAAVARFGGVRARRWVGGASDASLLRAQLDTEDGWLPSFGDRTDVRAWISRLPGLRRQR